MTSEAGFQNCLFLFFSFQFAAEMLKYLFENKSHNPYLKFDWVLKKTCEILKTVIY